MSRLANNEAMLGGKETFEGELTSLNFTQLSESMLTYERTRKSNQAPQLEKIDTALIENNSRPPSTKR